MPEGTCYCQPRDSIPAINPINPAQRPFPKFVAQVCNPCLAIWKIALQGLKFVARVCNPCLAIWKIALQGLNPTNERLEGGPVVGVHVASLGEVELGLL